MYNGVKSWQTGRAQAPQQMQPSFLQQLHQQLLPLGRMASGNRNGNHPAAMDKSYENRHGFQHESSISLAICHSYVELPLLIDF